MFGDLNAGDEAICRAMVEGLEATLDCPSVTVITADAGRSRAFTGLERVTWIEGQAFRHRFWLNLGSVLEAVRRADVIVVGGGGLFQDQFGWQLPAGSALVAGAGILLGTPTAVLGVGIGPIRRPWLRSILGAILSRVAHVSVRDEESLTTARALGVPEEKLSLGADVVSKLDLRAVCDLREPARPRREVGVVLRDWPTLDPSGAARLLDALVEAGEDIRLIAFSPDDDLRLYDSVLRHCRPRTREVASVVVPDTLAGLVEAVWRCRSLVSMRFHGCLLALATETPLLPVSAEPKIGGLMRQLGLEEVMVDTEGLGVETVQHLQRATIKGTECRRAIEAKYEDYVERGGRSFVLVRELLRAADQTARAEPSRVPTAIAFVVLLVLATGLEIFRGLTLPARRFRRWRSPPASSVPRRADDFG